MDIWDRDEDVKQLYHFYDSEGSDCRNPTEIPIKSMDFVNSTLSQNVAPVEELQNSSFCSNAAENEPDLALISSMLQGMGNHYSNQDIEDAFIQGSSDLFNDFNSSVKNKYRIAQDVLPEPSENESVPVLKEANTDQRKCKTEEERPKKKTNYNSKVIKNNFYPCAKSVSNKLTTDSSSKCNVDELDLKKQESHGNFHSDAPSAKKLKKIRNVALQGILDKQNDWNDLNNPMIHATHSLSTDNVGIDFNNGNTNDPKINKEKNIKKKFNNNIDDDQEIIEINSKSSCISEDGSFLDDLVNRKSESFSNGCKDSSDDLPLKKGKKCYFPDINIKEKVSLWLNSNNNIDTNYGTELSKTQSKMIPIKPKKFVPNEESNRIYQQLMNKKIASNNRTTSNSIWDHIKDKIETA